MEPFVKTFCRLCRNVVSGGDFEAIGEITGEILNILHVKLSAQEKNIFVTCNVCSTKLFAAFHFKAVCMDTEDCIFPYVHSGSGAPVDLIEVYLKERGKEHLKDILEDERVCRLCMQIVTCEFTPVEEMDVDTLRRYIPEVNFGSTEEPIICKICVDSLDTHTNFLNNLLNVMKESEGICDSKAIENLSSIKFEEVDIKSEDNYGDTPLGSLKDEPLNCIRGYRSEHAKTFNDCRRRSKWKRQQLTHKDISEKQVYQCHLCDYKTEIKAYFTRHQFRRHEKHWYTCDSCNFKTIYKQNVIPHQLRHKDISEKRMYHCYICDYRTDQRGCFTRHQLKHKKHRYTCDSCDFKTIYKYYITQHQLRHKIIEEDKMYKCDSCDYKARQKCDLIQHQHRHRDILEKQMYYCDLCRYKTDRKACLAKHQHKHKKYRYECDSCDFKTVYKCNLAQHQLRHKGIPEDQMYKCDSCDYKSGQKTNLKRHKLTHQDIPENKMYKCHSCDFKTIHKHSLAGHQLRHKGIPEDQMYKCDSCDYKTGWKNNFTRHQLTHKDEIYKCESCDFKTADKHYIAQHQLTHKDNLEK